eukprot:COSAG04_NODE_3166_length_3098_cov_1.577526_1_plen_42_part_10
MDWWSMKKPASPRQCTDAEDGTLHAAQRRVLTPELATARSRA